jgi:hypothetical protein
MLGTRTRNEWIAQYESSHQHPLNRLCHNIGIPVIALSILIAPAVLILPDWWPVPVTLFSFGWILQFVGHGLEGKRPEFFNSTITVFYSWVCAGGLRKSTGLPKASSSVHRGVLAGSLRLPLSPTVRSYSPPPRSPGCWSVSRPHS